MYLVTDGEFMGQLDGRTALVTGGSSGIGLAIARCLIEEGATVHVSGRRSDTLHAAVSDLGPRAHGIVGDVGDTSDLDRLFSAITRLDIVVANAGGGRHTPFEEVTEAEFDATFTTNVRGQFFTVQKALPLLTDGASVILVSSVAGVNGSPGQSVYAATKAASRNLVRSWAAELAPRGIRVNALLPGPTGTPGIEQSRREVLAKGDTWTHTTPLGDLVPVEQVAAAALYLASDHSTYITGTDLIVDGGNLVA